MPYRVDAYMAEGVASGMVVRAGHLRDQLEQLPDLAMTAVSWQSLDGSRSPGRRRRRPSPSTTCSSSSPTTTRDPPVHAAWHSIQLEVGPYSVSGDLPTMPGFDPGRALTRPTRRVRAAARRPKLGLLDDPGRDHRSATTR